ncbi:MAG: class Ib ribonucleoside-diphosphate reductase assembly flavoprotein NrdI [Lachnospiraceae bacterium]|nr:class Ib ribonucleoside-diphosphate reductase assembly flavoprotein NrdI [Lachnospiraceae bacterium]
MKIVYASRNGHVEAVIHNLGIQDALKIKEGTEKVKGDYVIFTYTDGEGILPPKVKTFLAANPGVKAVVSSGNSQRHPATYNFAADIIAREYGAKIIAKIDGSGTDHDMAEIRAALNLD